MSQVEVTVNGRAYKITCDNGQEGRLQQLASYFDRHVTQVARDLGQIGDARLMLLAALSISDELFEARRKIADFDRAADALDAETVGGASRVIDAATRRIETIAGKVERA